MCVEGGDCTLLEGADFFRAGIFAHLEPGSLPGPVSPCYYSLTIDLWGEATAQGREAVRAAKRL